MADDKVEKRAIAKHELLAADGSVVEDFEDAHGIRYTDLASGLSVDYLPKNPNALRMGAAFGFRTLATNEASQARQRDGSAQDQIDAIRDRFDLIENQSQWVDRTREGGVRWDLPTLATAAVNVAIANGKVANDDSAKGAAFQKFSEFLAADPGNVAKIRSVDGVEAEYRKLRGKTAKTADDLMAMVG